MKGRQCYKVKWIRAVRDQDVVVVSASKEPRFLTREGAVDGLGAESRGG